jgi:tRNA A-37 threonylcarbamoyl transferase component Bud32
MKVLSKDEYQQLLKETKVIEQDKHGEKVLEYPDGRYMKLFRLKRLISSALIYPYWRRFVRNAKGLKRLEIPTVATIESVLKVPHIKKTAVIYQPLLGDTIIHLYKKNTLTNELIKQFGEFVATLHYKGVYFSSLHLGNVVLTPENKLGLIDISDMRIVRFPIPVFTREANMRYLFHCRQGLKLLSPTGVEHFIEGYLSKTKQKTKPRMAEFFNQQRKIMTEKVNN